MPGTTRWLRGDPEARLEAQDLYLTVPASFDAVARELTVQAARSAGLEHFTLLEEPQAAFYAWLESRKDQWREAVEKGDSILVCDVGGGTTDFSLIVVTEEEGNLALKRVAVGDHILLGGDNMDLTLAHVIRAKLPEKSRKLDAWQFRGLWHSCQAAKERLLGDSALESEPVVILGRGSSLIGGTLRTELTRKEAESVLLDGFLPLCESSELPEEGARAGDAGNGASLRVGPCDHPAPCQVLDAPGSPIRDRGSRRLAYRRSLQRRGDEVSPDSGSGARRAPQLGR